MYSYVFWFAESESEDKIAPFTVGFWHNLKKRTFEYVIKNMFCYGIQAADSKNRARLVI